MTAFNPIPLMKLYNMSKKAKYDGYGHKIVYIDARKKYRQELVQYYKDIRTVFNKGQQMTWLQLYDFLDRNLKEVVIVLE